MENLLEDWQTIPESELRRIYLKNLKIQKTLSRIPVIILLPAVLYFGFTGWFTTIMFLGWQVIDTSVLGFLDFVVFALCGVLFTTRNKKTLFLTIAVMALQVALKLLFSDNISVMPFIMLGYVIFASAVLYKVISRLEFLRSLPEFPFNESKQELKIESMTHDQMLKYMERQAKGGVESVGYENIFTAEHPEEIATPPEKTEEYLQQHKMKYNGINYSGRK